MAEKQYTRQAQEALNMARKIAAELKHPYVGTEHLLFGLKRVFTGVAGQVLDKNKVDEEQMEKAAGIRGEVTEIGWGNQIRSYVMQPYTMVKDRRTGVESGNVDNVMDGDIDLFINGYLKWLSLGCPDNMSADIE